MQDAATGQQVTWEGMVQVLPMQPALMALFTNAEYVEAAAVARERYRFTADLEH